MTSTLPEGWIFEPEDTSVGIFGDLIAHEECGTDQEAVVVATETSRVDGNTRYETKYRCPACGAEMIETQTFPGWEEEETNGQ